MIYKDISKIGDCVGCYEKPAEYIFIKTTFLGTYIRHFCKKCAKLQSDKEGLGVI